MANLNTKYIGLQLKNPLIVSSSGLTDNPEKVKRAADAGAGAIVLKSLFEEQINYEAGRLLNGNHSGYPEAMDYIRNYSKSNSLDEYLVLIENAKKSVDIPVIASINCISVNDWIGFSKQIENAGADALELNAYFIPTDKKRGSGDYEKMYFDLAARIKETVDIPVALKLGSNFTNLIHIITQLYFRKIEGVVLFNKFYEPDIDVDKLKFRAAGVFSTPSDISRTLRWTGIISDQVPQIDIAASTGVYDGKSAVKLLLAGATAVQVCSVLYKNGVSYLQTLLQEIESWMEEHGFNSVDDFRGRLNYGRIIDPAVYERSQFMRYFSNYT
jgi:dihydroorotate dehydrogenase (fumarate)